MNKKELIEKAQAFLKTEYDFREEIRHYLSAILMDTDEEHQMETDIVLDEDKYMGTLSSLELPHVTSCWQHPTEGWICFHLDGYEYSVDFDDMDTQELITIVEGLD